MMLPNNFDIARRFLIVFTLLVLQGGLLEVASSSVCSQLELQLSSRLVSYRETYTKRGFMWRKKKATRINYRWETFPDWVRVYRCCPGYSPQGVKLSSALSSNCSPICQSGCSNGQCIAINTCRCNEGYRAVVTHGLSRCIPHCMGDGPDGCGYHGSCSAPKKCVCDNGYTFTVTRTNDKTTSSIPCIPECKPGCGKNAFCLSPNKCICNIGYTRILTKKLTDDSFNCEPSCAPKCGNNMNCFAPNKCQCDSGYLSTSLDVKITGNSERPQDCSPVCNPPCINGTCTRPGYCECHHGYMKTSTGWQYECSPICNPSCINATCTKPNYCECHTGYQKNSENPQVCLPHCDPPCINGTCTKPGYCECHTGYQKKSKNSEVCSPHCDPPCINGTCTKPGYCGCHTGYQKKSENSQVCSPHCDPPCINGTCTKPGYCECHTGYQKKSENSQVCSAHCDPPCINGTCTRPGICECHIGHQKKSDLDPRICSPHCDPPCINGTCTKPGCCECHTGYQKKSENSQVCSPYCDPPCINGTCTEPGICECHIGHQKKSDLDPRICSPHCDPPCINGICTKPGYCECQDGYKKDLKNLSQVCLPVCDPPCVNATCTGPNHCDCYDGYEKELNGQPQFCSPVCKPGCNPNAFCYAPNKCLCNTGYTITNTESYLDTTAYPLQTTSPTNHLQTIDNSTSSIKEISCEPVCEPDCKENESCVAPNTCQCNSGYRPDIVKGNLTQCLPICEPSCVNAYCGEPNKCICLPGYEPHYNDGFTCDPVCQDDCFNATCTRPNYCECYEGYEKILMSTQSPYREEIYENTCIPSCPEQCLNGSCIAPGRCLCDPGYVLNSTLLLLATTTQVMIDYDDSSNNTNTINETFVQFCQPLCEPACPMGTECLSPNQCEPQPDDSQDFNEFSINSTDVIYSIEDCGSNVDFLDENGKCVCRYGWKGWKCEKPSLCGLVIRDSFKDDEEFTTLQSTTVLSNDTMDTMEPVYDDFSDTRMISSDEDSGVLIDWQGPMCREVCRIMTSSEISGNRSDDGVNCYLLEAENVTTGVFSIRDQVLLPGSRIGTFICFISIDSSCNVPDSEIVGGPLDSLMAIIIGTTILLLLVVVVGFVIYCRKVRAVVDSPDHSMSNTTMLIHPESIPLYATEESSSIHALRQHMLRHAGKNYKCGLPGCPTVLRTANELKSHRLLVHESASSDRQFRCNECSYAAKTRTQLRRHHKRHELPTEEENPRQLLCSYGNCNFTTKVSSHLTRHIRLHTGTKPYKCRHCKYASNNLENLRKHVLSTSLHPGKTIYECDACQTSGSTDSYCTNFAKELRAHLLEVHPREFPRPSHASDHVASIFGTDQDQASPTSDVIPYEDSITVDTMDHAIKTEGKPHFTT